MTNGSMPDRRHQGAGSAFLAAASHLGHGLGDGRDVLGRGAAAAADDVEQARGGEFADDRAAMSSGVWSYSPKALGSPALGGC